MALVTSSLPARIFTRIDKQDLEKRSLYEIFERTYNRKLQWAEEVIGAVTASPDDARVLQAKTGSPLLLIKETTYDSQDIPIEFSVSLLRGDRYTASVISVRKKWVEKDCFSPEDAIEKGTYQNLIAPLCPWFKPTLGEHRRWSQSGHKSVATSTN